MTTLDEFIRLLETADEAIDRNAAYELINTTEELRAYAQAIAHKRTGYMAASMHRLGPFPIGLGGLETRVESGAWYATEEIKRGGDHDWVTRTLDERQDMINRLEDKLAVIVERALGLR